jgi:hypothetical protein
MASRKHASAPDPTPMPRIGDKVAMPPSTSVREITSVSSDGSEVNLHRPGTNLEWFRVKTSELNFVERRPIPTTSNPFTTPEPEFDAAEIIAKIESIREANLKRCDEDIDIMKAYLKTQGVSKDVIASFETLTIEQHKSWKATIKRIAELLN